MARIHVLLFVALLALPRAGSAEAPGRGGVTLVAGMRGWWHAGMRPDLYSVTADRNVVHGGKVSAQLKSLVPAPDGFGSLMQIFGAEKWRGKRIRMSAFVKSDGVARHAALWMRVDGADRDGGKWLAFDNMQDRPIVGTTGWTRYEIVLDVPSEATQVACGATLNGAGTVWVDDVKFEEVNRSVPTTGPFSPSTLAAGPQNLGFEE